MPDDRAKAEAQRKAQKWLRANFGGMFLQSWGTTLEGPITSLILDVQEETSGDIVPALKSWVGWLKKAPQGEIHKAGVQQGRKERDSEVARVVQEVLVDDVANVGTWHPCCRANIRDLVAEFKCRLDLYITESLWACVKRNIRAWRE